jgi:hypothetical protein
MGTTTGLQRERVLQSATRSSIRVVRGSDDRGCRPATVDDVVPAVCFLALVGVVVLGGLLMLFSWVTTALPTRSVIACHEFDGCAISSPDEDQRVWPIEPQTQEPTRIP